MKVEEHIKAFKEHRDAIDWAIDRGIESSQRIIGVHSSRGIVELLSAYLHKISKIDAGFQINHRWFKSEKVSGKFPEFPKKKIIINKLVDLENKSESLTYGSSKTEAGIQEILGLFNELEKIITGLMENEE